jgi:hypothetical protein
LKRDISTLDKTEQLEILKIIKSSGNKLTENKNGIFINLSYVSPESIQEIQKFVHYSIENKSRLENLERLSEELFKTSMLKKGYDNFDNTNHKDSNSQTNETQESSEHQDTHDGEDREDGEEDDPLDKSMEGTNSGMKFDEEIEIENSEIQDQEEETDLVAMKVNKDTCNDEEELDEMDIQEEEDKGVEAFSVGIVRKNRFTGRKAKLVKKCKEITRNSQTELSYYNFLADTVKDDDNQSDCEDEPDLNPTEIANELVEET